MISKYIHNINQSFDSAQRPVEAADSVNLVFEHSVTMAEYSIPVPEHSVPVAERSRSHGKVYINDTQYFNNVPETAWNFYIGGYQPAQKWLKDRKDRKL